MELDSPRGPHHSTTGCWTCRLRRKKCDEHRPLCDTCTNLLIKCHYGDAKPEWMDGGVEQEAMAAQLKREVKDNAHLRLRRKERKIHTSTTGNHIPAAESTNGALPREQATTTCLLPKTTAKGRIQNDGTEEYPEASIVQSQLLADCGSKNTRENTSIHFKPPDTVLLTFYLEHLFPFLFPFYRPSILQGGRAWVLEMMIGSQVFKKVILCQASYYLSLARGTSADVDWQTVLAQTMDYFGMLRHALGIIDGSSIAEHRNGAVRILTSILQVQRFDIVISGFENCQSHLNAALALFVPLLNSASDSELTGPASSFNAILRLLKPLSSELSADSVQVPSAEQAAFCFSSALLVLDDIIASTVLQEEPRLYGYHRCLLGNIDGRNPSIDLGAVIGCQNWALLQIGEIAVLDAWKQRCKRAGNLDVMELVRRATAIKDFLETHLTLLGHVPMMVPHQISNLLDILSAESSLESSTTQRSLVTRIWVHAAHLYLFTVVSGWQPANTNVRYHVSQILELLMNQLSPPPVLHSMVWPFCVAGCLAEPEQETLFRGVVEAIQPASVFGTVRKALEIMGHVWANRNTADVQNFDLAACFKSHGNLVLLV